LRKLLCPGVASDYEFCRVSIHATLNRRASALLQDKEQHGRLSDFHLLVIAGSLECFASRQQRGGQFFGTFHRSSINRLGNAVEFPIGGIEQNHSPIREDASIKTSKGRAQRFSWPVRFTQELRSLGVSKQFCCFFDQRHNFIP
jgi:hypothetical protein